MSGTTCPACGVTLAAKAVIPDEQRLELSIKFTGDVLAARTVWGTLKDTETLLKACAKAEGVAMNVYVVAMAQAAHELTISLLLTTAAPSPAAARRDRP